MTGAPASRRSLGIVAVCAGLALAWWVWPTDARRIEARLHAAADALSSTDGEAGMSRAVRLASFAQSLTPDVVVEAEDGGASVRGRDSVAGLAVRLAGAGAGGARRIELRDVRVTIDDDGARATAFAVPRVTPADVPELEDGTVLRFDLARVDGEWLIARARPERPLDR
jgi:hypothetical protein